MRIKFILYFLFIVLFISCKKKEDTSAPHITTDMPIDITHKSAKLSGSGIDNGPIIEKGFCWSDSKTPDISDNKIVVGDGEANFQAILTNLLPDHLYFVRAYATNKYRTGYGAVADVATTKTPETPTVERLNTYSITKTSAVLKGFIKSFGQSALDSFGVCWSTHPDPTIQDQMQLIKLTNGVQNFETSINGLKPNTLYYIRPFTITDYGTFYSPDNTLLKTYYGTVTDYDNNVYFTVKIGDKEWMAENLKVTRFNDGTAIQNANAANTWYYATKPAYCENNPVTTHGNLYNWYCAFNGRNIAPVGWHVPTLEEWQALLSNGGGAYKDIAFRIQGNEFWYGNNQATNENGFSVIGSGVRDSYGDYNEKTGTATFWMNSEYYYCMTFSQGNYISYLNAASPLYGFSIRCIKD